MSKLVKLSQFKKTFTGKCLGIGLSARGEDKNDNHVMIHFLVEDDGNWFEMHNSFSSYWLPEFSIILNECYTWIWSNCDPAPDGYGHSFRSRRKVL